MLMKKPMMILAAAVLVAPAAAFAPLQQPGRVVSPSVLLRASADDGNAAMSVADAVADAMSTPEGTTELKTLWDTIDKDGDGKVTGKEWGSKVYAEQTLMSKYFGGSDMAAIGTGFNRINADGDDSLTWEEFQAQVAVYNGIKQLKAAMATEEGQAELKGLWDRLDKDGDGKVTGKEWGSKVYSEKDIMSKYFGGSDMASIGKGFNRIDADGNDLLTWDEFVSGVKSY